MRRQRGLFNIVAVHTSVDVREIRSSLIPVAMFSGLKKNTAIFKSLVIAILCLDSYPL